jgi:hypothetical protein
VNGGGRYVQFGEANRTVIWLGRVAARAGEREAWDLVDEAVRCMLAWDGAWDQWNAQDQITLWLRKLSGDAAQIVAAALQAHPSAARHFGRLAEDGRVDSGIRRHIQNGIERGRSLHLTRGVQRCGAPSLKVERLGETERHARPRACFQVLIPDLAHDSGF